MRNRPNVCGHVDGFVKWLLIDEKYPHLVIEGLIGLFRVSWGFKNYVQYAKVYSTMLVCVQCAE